jgi:murein DD-endopeptidase MepM/ murein hydrolase activator NlpD
MKKRWFSIIMAFILVISFSVPSIADEITDKQNQVKQINDNIDKMEDQKDTLEEQIDDTSKKVKTIETDIAGINADIKTTQSKINSVQSKIDTTTKELNAAIDEYNGQDDSMKKRINALYRNGTSTNYLQVIIESKSFADFISNLDVMQKIVDYDVTMLKKMKEMRDSIAGKKTALEGDKSELVSLKSDLDGKKGKLVSQKSEQTKLVSLLSRSVADLNSKIAAEEASAKKLEKEITNLMNKKKNYDGSKYAILHRSDYPSGKSPKITSYFGSRRDPITGRMGAYHSGMDIGTGGASVPVYAMSGGKVIIARWYGGYGNCIVIDHGSSIASLYGHNSKLLVKEGDTVMGGQQIAVSGSTGRSTGPHVHFGIQKNGAWINPEPYLLIGY